MITENISIIDLYDKINQLTDTDIYNMFDQVVEWTYTNNLNQNYHLYTLDAVSRVNEVVLPDEICKNTNIVYDQTKLKKYYRQELLDFIEVMRSNLNQKDLYNFYANADNIAVIQKPHKRKNVSAVYNTSKNIITLYEGYNKVDYAHEFFHVASTVQNDKHVISGFSYDNVGIALNEGYTELLTSRYFNNNQENYNDYLDFKRMANVIENIVGKDKMQSLYLRADLKGLTIELSKYINSDKVALLITSMDYVLENQNKIYDNEFIKNSVIENYKSINSLLMKIATNKVLSNLEEHNKTFNVLYKEVELMTNSLTKNKFINNERVSLIDTNDDIYQYMYEELNNKSR
jgi:hypothetical protein